LIMGITIPAIALLICVMCIFWKFKKRMHRRDNYESLSEDHLPSAPDETTPIIIAGPSSQNGNNLYSVTSSSQGTPDDFNDWMAASAPLIQERGQRIQEELDQIFRSSGYRE